jgi:hypothetical protein
MSQISEFSARAAMTGAPALMPRETALARRSTHCLFMPGAATGAFMMLSLRK